ncbi:helix-turn-helix transcriptional regulator [Lactococcus lactis subsp. lactis]|uniref:helix-turn-helix domain-containing protein n=1 Tax=Lactococcus lactis TaxID=1358 RepID=UPI002A7FD5EB|nr:helix-turn-helix transcriptional regulator [Lactococcus lactis]MDY4364260.1 helix-turn-helix transcriptional regulator [Lactococcus lactis subsp. lactis]
MLLNRLAELLAQRKIKISRMSVETSLSRTTLTSLSQNNSQRADFDTLNTILNYLKITPEEFFYYSPIDIDIKSSFDEEDSFNIFEEPSIFLFISKYGVNVGTIEYTAVVSKKEDESTIKFNFESTDFGQNDIDFLSEIPTYILDTFFKSKVIKKLDKYVDLMNPPSSSKYIFSSTNFGFLTVNPFYTDSPF